jgi:GNAT superfamily N-acetyltransferase
MTVELYVGKDDQGRAWAPDFVHEAEAAIRIAGKAWRAFHDSPEILLLAFNLHSPNIDLLVLSERGIGIVEMKAHHGRIVYGEEEYWLADGRKMVGYREIPGKERPASSYRNPHGQVQGHGTRLMEKLLPWMRAEYPVLSRGKRRSLRLQTSVCFTNPEADLTEMRPGLAGWNDGKLKHWESDFTLTTPDDIPEWISTLRFEVKVVDTPPYNPFRLEPARMRPMLHALFPVERWTGVENTLPVTRYGRLDRIGPGGPVASFSLWEEETFIGRDHLRCTIVVPQTCSRVSRVHAVLRRGPEGAVLEDLDSNNGTFLDGVRLTGKTRLVDGAVVSLGGSGKSGKECVFLYRPVKSHGEEFDTTEDGSTSGTHARDAEGSPDAKSPD